MKRLYNVVALIIVLFVTSFIFSFPVGAQEDCYAALKIAKDNCYEESKDCAYGCQRDVIHFKKGQLDEAEVKAYYACLYDQCGKIEDTCVAKAEEEYPCQPDWVLTGTSESVPDTNKVKKGDVPLFAVTPPNSTRVGHH